MVAVTPDAAVVDRVKLLSAAAERPALTDDEVTASIQNHPRVDRDGLWADDPAWTQTWDINAIVAELWAAKAAKVAGDFNFGADGANYSKGDVIAHCLEMEARYAAKAGGTLSTTPYDDQGPLGHGVVVNG